MYSNVDSHVLPQTEFNVEKLWAEGEVIKNHPRVRSARIGEQLVTVHRFSGTIPSGIKILIEHPDLAAVAGLKLANENFYVMDFVEGELLDSFPPRDAVGSAAYPTDVATVAVRAGKPSRSPA